MAVFLNKVDLVAAQPPKWVRQTIAIQRKTLVVYKNRRLVNHAGIYDGVSLKEGLLEIRMKCRSERTSRPSG